MSSYGTEASSSTIGIVRSAIRSDWESAGAPELGGAGAEAHGHLALGVRAAHVPQPDRAHDRLELSHRVGRHAANGRRPLRAIAVEPRLERIEFDAAARRAVPISGRVEDRIAVELHAELRGAQIDAEGVSLEVHPNPPLVALARPTLS